MRRSDWWIVGAVVLVVAALLPASVFIASLAGNQSVGAGTILSGVSTLFLAGLTAIILIVNARVLQATRDAAEATRDAARATKDEAVATEKEAEATFEQAAATKEQALIANETLKELRRTRELEWRPILVRDESNAGVKDGKAWRDVSLRNIGRGPALNCLVVREEMGTDTARFLASQPVSLGAAEGLSLRASELEQPPHSDMLYGHELPRELLICHDQFGNYLRFVPGFPSPAVWTWQDDELGENDDGEGEPSWVTGMKVLLKSSQQPTEVDPPSGPAFDQAIWVQGNYNAVHTTIAMEAVPPTDLKPTDQMRTTTGAWVNSVRPNAGPSSMAQARWQDPIGNNVFAPPWGAELEPGPTIAIRHAVEPQARPPLPNAPTTPEGDLTLPDLVHLWTRMIHQEIRLMEQLGARRVRFGLTMIPYGSMVDQARVVGLKFGTMTTPTQMVPVPAHEIRPWFHRSSAFAVGTWPASDIERAIRSLLRMFGYVAVDDLLSALRLQTPADDEPLAVDRGALT